MNDRQQHKLLEAIISISESLETLANHFVQEPVEEYNEMDEVSALRELLLDGLTDHLRSILKNQDNGEKP